VLCELGAADEAARLFAEALAICRQLGEHRVMLRCLEGVAIVAGDRGDGGGAALLWGAAAALREAIGMPVPPSERLAQEVARRRARTHIEAAAWATAWATGQGLTLAEALAEAFGTTGTATIRA
jgi:hypothetical protein